jgi:hypothetical protein
MQSNNGSQRKLTTQTVVYHDTMGKLIRTLYIFCTLVWTIASLVLLVVVMFGQLSTNNKAPPTSLGRNLYFLKVCWPSNPARAG